MGRPRAALTGPQWFRALADGWLRSLARRGRSRTTERTYGWLLRDLGRWLEHCRVEQAEHLVPPVLYGWQDQLIEGGASSSHQQLASIVLRGLLRWGAREELGVPAGLWEHIEPVSRPSREPRPIESDVLAKLLRHFAENGRELADLRDRALFLFLLTTGSRITAALSVRVDQARATRIIVRQKGGSEHALVPSALARRWLGDYLAARGRDDEPALWIRDGARGRHALLPQQVNALWAELCDHLRIERFTSHQLKHTSATQLGEFTGSDQELAEHIGWKGTAMVSRYRRIRPERRQELVDQLDQLVPQPPPAAAPRRRRRPASMRVIRGPRRRTDS